MTMLSFNSEDQWLAARRSHITSTDLAKILGVSKFGDPLSVYLAKTGQTERSTPSRKMIAGLRYQDAILSDYELETKHRVERINPYDIGIHKDGVLAASLDALDLQDGRSPVDAKNIAYLKEEDGWGDDGSSDIPMDYRLQLAAQMAVTGAKLSHLAVLVSGWDLRIYHQTHDAELEGMILEAAAKFWKDHVIALKPPPLEGSKDAQSYLDRAYPINRGLMIEAMEDDGPWMDYLKTADQDLDNAKMRVDEARVWFKSRIGEAEGIFFPDGRKITWKKSKGTSKTDWEAVAKAAGASPDLVAKFTTEGQGSRRFLPKF